jgi:hypothetical protein
MSSLLFGMPGARRKLRIGMGRRTFQAWGTASQKLLGKRRLWPKEAAGRSYITWGRRSEGGEKGGAGFGRPLSTLSSAGLETRAWMGQVSSVKV